MTQPRQQRVIFTIKQKLDYAKLMAYENYTNKQIILSIVQVLAGLGLALLKSTTKQNLTFF